MEKKIYEKTVIVFGATGLIGSHLVKELIKNPDTSRIIIYSRSSLKISHYKIVERIIDLDELIDFDPQDNPHAVYCCLGTTLKKAGSKEMFKKVDHDYPVKIAQMAKKNGIKQYIVISSIGADAGSRNFYLRVKGEMENDVLNIGIPRTIFFRPSFLLGKRDEFRLGEEVGKVMIKLINPFLRGKLKKYKPIKAKDIAKAMVNISKFKETKKYYYSGEIKKIGNVVG